MFNRAVTSTVTRAGGNAVTLLTNYYDNDGGCGRFAQGPVGPLYELDTRLCHPTVPGQCGLSGDAQRQHVLRARRSGDGADSNRRRRPCHHQQFQRQHELRRARGHFGRRRHQHLAYTAFLGIASVSEANGSASLFSYDAGARPIETTSPHGAKTTYSYTTSPPTATATTNGRFVKTSYDGLGRTIRWSAATVPPGARWWIPSTTRARARLSAR